MNIIFLISRRICLIVFSVLGLVHYTAGQEYMQIIQHPSFTEADTIRIRDLIRKGIPMLYRNTDSAHFLFEEAVALSRAVGFEDGVGYALVFMGVAATDQGNYKEGFAYYQEALPYCKRAKYIKKALPSLYINMGASWAQMGEEKKANDLYYKALEYMQEYLPDDENIIVVYNNLSTIQGKLGQQRKSLQYAQKAEDLSRKHNIPIILGGAYLNKGTAYAALNEGDSALVYYQKALELGAKAGLIDVQQAALTSTGDLMLGAGKNREAVRYYEQAMHLSRKTNVYHSSIMPAYSLGLAWFRLKEYKKAEEVLLSALMQAKATHMGENQKNAHATLVDIYEATGRYQEALQQQKKYNLLKDSQTDVNRIRAINEVEAKYRTAQKDKELISKGLTIAQQQRRLERKNLLVVAVIGGAVLLFLIAIGFYRSKRKISNRDREIEQLRAMMAGEEKERTRISRELHDGIGGMLTGIKMNLKTLQKQHEKGPVPAGLNEIMIMLQGMGEEIHKTAHNLMPDILLKHSLEDALRLYCEQLDTGSKLKIDLQFYGPLDGLEKSLELPIYRMVQELMQNIIKHAKATHAAIQIRRDEHKLCISVEDNGVGFDRKVIRSGLGLQNLEARMQTLGGYFSIESALGMGTTAYIEIDLKN